MEEIFNCDDLVLIIFKLGDVVCLCNNVVYVGVLKYVNGKVYLCVGMEWKIFFFEVDYGMGSINLGLFC